ncbi:MAG: response regulator [Candidatus Saganbacteria bacterium]|nr:response regulator [Candidatus Saganbacteria bacterium]
MRILIADDDEAIRSSIEKILTQGEGNVIDLATDGQQALDKAKNLKYDLILLDLDMPKMNGYQVLEDVRKVFPDVPVVFITATGETQKVMKSIAQYRLNGFIEKPFTPEQVVDIVATATRSQKKEG